MQHLPSRALQLMWPPPPLPEQPKPQPKKVKAVEQQEEPADPFWTQASNVALTTGGLIALAGVGVSVPASWVGNMTVFSLSTLVGYQVVLAVSPALHTPLMSVTNAISGSVIVGGLLLTGGGIYPTKPSQILAIGSVLMASINIAGGFHVTGRMLDMFKKGDGTEVPQYNYLWAVPALVWSGLYVTARLLGGYKGMDSLSYLTGTPTLTPASLPLLLLLLLPCKPYFCAEIFISQHEVAIMCKK